MKELVFLDRNSGQPVTTTLVVAEIFGKEHKNVLRDIDNLSCSPEFHALNFEQMFSIRELPNGGSRQERYFTMSRDGFAFLVMGYTGEKAAKFKEAFLEAFNKNEALLSSDDYILARSQQILRNRLDCAQRQLREQQQILIAQGNQIAELAPKAKYTDEVLQSTSGMTFTEVAKELGYRSAKAFLDKLVSARVLYRQSGRYLPMAKYSDKGYFSTRTHRFYHSDGRPDCSVMTVVTQKGRAFLNLHFNNN